jgi:hypothetical protein
MREKLKSAAVFIITIIIFLIFVALAPR